MKKYVKIYQVYENLTLDIQEVKCSKITDSSYWTMNSNMRNALNTNYVKSFLNKSDAVNYLKGKLKAKIFSCKSNVEYYENEFAKFESLYKSDL